MFRLKIMLPLLFNALQAGNRKFLLNMIGTPIALGLVMLLVFSPKAAVISLIIYAGITVAIFAFIIITFNYMPEIALKPAPFRASTNLEAVERLAGNLVALGFVPSGLFIATASRAEMGIEGWAHIDLRAYAMIAVGNKTTNSFVEFNSYYADGSFFCVSGSKIKPSLPAPANMIHCSYPGQTTADLWEIFLRGRPAGIMFETPQNQFQAAMEYETRIRCEYIQKLKGGLV